MTENNGRVANKKCQVTGESFFARIVVLHECDLQINIK